MQPRVAEELTPTDQLKVLVSTLEFRHVDSVQWPNWVNMCSQFWVCSVCPTTNINNTPRMDNNNNNKIVRFSYKAVSYPTRLAFVRQDTTPRTTRHSLSVGDRRAFNIQHIFALRDDANAANSSLMACVDNKSASACAHVLICLSVSGHICIETCHG